jgi:hypothetical protein
MLLEVRSTLRYCTVPLRLSGVIKNLEHVTHKVAPARDHRRESRLLTSSFQRFVQLVLLTPSTTLDTFDLPEVMENDRGELVDL